MLGRIRELINSIDNHMDMLDDLNEKFESAIRKLRSHYGY